MNGITFVLFLVLTTVAIRNASDVIVLNEKPPMPATSVGDQCHRRQYTFRLVQTDASGRQCWDLVNVWACFGVCVSQQIADWKFPHRLSYHPVCMHDGRSKAVAYLRQCDEGVSAETRRYEYVEAVACKCQVGGSGQSVNSVLMWRGTPFLQTCTTKDTRCEALQYGPANAEGVRVLNMVDSEMDESAGDDANMLGMMM